MIWMLDAGCWILDTGYWIPPALSVPLKARMLEVYNFRKIPPL